MAAAPWQKSCSPTSLARIDEYANARDFPAVKGPSYLGVHLRFGTISIRRVAGAAHAHWRRPDGTDAAPRPGCRS